MFSTICRTNTGWRWSFASYDWNSDFFPGYHPINPYQLRTGRLIKGKTLGGGGAIRLHEMPIERIAQAAEVRAWIAQYVAEVAAA